MNVAIKHNNSTITGRVISYEREHRICTSIGTLNITLEGTYSTTINPWDTIDVYENGSFQVRYYVSDVNHSVPGGTINLQCQDISKRLVDYFIPDQYTIDYPSTTRYWIEKFLDEAGISYSFQTSSQGNLLSNYTALGLQPAYDQIMLLLQLSGWYMYFDGNGVAIIGSLDVDLAATAGTLGTTDILDIKKISNDKMLRNRALIWGAYDPFSQGYAFADVTKMTPWNYDSNDIRTMVVSNQNIPNSSSAYSIANVLLKEFAKITIEKHIVAWGARNFDLGDGIRVNSNVWKGKGLVTTFGVSMGRDGLVTNIVLDERCPRLFGFFNFGDYVYVGTFGDGIWRKHIKFDPSWYDFSSGLTNLNITDLYINNGVFGSVGHSGEMFYANSEEGPWYQIPIITGLESAVDDLITESGFERQIFSGIMARAVVIDKTTNNVKFGVDNYSGLNTGDYFLTYSGMFITTSGTTSSGISVDRRGWILEYDPHTGVLVTDAIFSGVTSSGVYPISYSGNYDIRVLDLENDGLNDYVSVKTNTEQEIPHTDLGYNMGLHVSQLAKDTQDDNTIVAISSLNEFDEAPNTTLTGSSTSGATGVVIFDNESINERDIVFWTGRFNRIRISTSPLTYSLIQSPIPSPALTSSGRTIVKLSTDNYRIYSLHVVSDLSYKVEYIDWDADANTITGTNILVDYAITDNTFHNSTTEHFWNSFIITGTTIYWVINHEIRAGNPAVGDPDWNNKADNYLEMHLIKVDLVSGVGSGGLKTTILFTTSVEDIFGDDWSIQNIDSNVKIAQNGNIAEAFFILQVSHTTYGPTVLEKTNYLIYSHDCETYLATEIESTIDGSGDPFLNANNGGNSLATQLTGEHFFALWRDTSQNKSYIYNGDTLQITTLTSIPWNYTPDNIYPLFGTYDNYFIAVNGSTWYFCNPQTLAPTIEFVPPINYTITKPYSTTDSASPRYYWQARNALGTRTLLQTTESTTMSECQPDTSYAGTQSERAFICGNIFINYNTSTSTLSWIYLNNYLNVPKIGTSSYMVLQREGLDFNLIQESGKPIRVDISNNSPVLTVLDNEDTFISNFPFGQELSVVIPISGLIADRQVRDYRYTLLETTASGTIIGSGAGVTSQILYVFESGVYHSDSYTYSGGFLILDVIPSGSAERIETTNFTYPGQFIFVTTSGDNPMFYQKDNDGLAFVSYSGLPDSRATIIRCDDRL